MQLKTMDPELALKLLEGHRDTVTPLAEERERFYQSQICPSCDGDALTKVGDSRFLFRKGEALPRFQLQCDNCSCVFDPFTGLQLTMGNRARAMEPIVPLLDGPED